jgi:hypothetical protein
MGSVLGSDGYYLRTAFLQFAVNIQALRSSDPIANMKRCNANYLFPRLRIQA